MQEQIDQRRDVNELSPADGMKGVYAQEYRKGEISMLRLISEWPEMQATIMEEEVKRIIDAEMEEDEPLPEVTERAP